MRHDWIFDVLRDLRAYAQANGLPALAAKADEALRVARAELPAAPLAAAKPDQTAETDEAPNHGLPGVRPH
ncbi:hypothetical protein [Tabrizicola sp.]|jgi:hypothetical protein|uniref:hypothetical protein n=1 Tax=Tabrizicola sp. TaxID=2005166 RepID=UPI003D2C9CDE